MSKYTSALDIRGMSRVTAVSPPVHSKRSWAGKKQWQVFIIQFITTLTIIFKCICKLCSLLFCQFKQIKIIFAHIVINIILRELITDSLSLYSSAAIFPTVQNNLTPSLEMDKFCAPDTFPHSGSGQARLIKALCGLSKHSSGPVTLARGNWHADHVTDRRRFQRQNRCSGRPEGRECLCLPLSSGSQEWRERFSQPL